MLLMAARVTAANAEEEKLIGTKRGKGRDIN